MKDLEDWIKQIQETHPDLKGHSICPFAKASTYKIIKTSINDIQPLDEEFDVVIFVVENELTFEQCKQKVQELNQKYPKYTFFEDVSTHHNFINEVKTNNPSYNLILCQDREFLSRMRQKLAKTNYYDFWSDDYLKKILESDYEIVQKIRNK